MDGGSENPTDLSGTFPRNVLFDKLRIVFLLGAPGVGKGTLCRKLVEEVPCYHLSVGDYLRELRSSVDGLSDEALGGLSITDLKTKLEARELLAAGPMVAILRHKFEQETANGYTTIIVDGFPRTSDSAELFEKKIGLPTMVLWFDCPRETAEARFLNRRREGGDDRVMFAKRYAEFEANNPLIANRYASKLKIVDTSGVDLLASYPNLEQYFSTINSRERSHDSRD